MKNLWFWLALLAALAAGGWVWWKRNQKLAGSKPAILGDYVQPDVSFSPLSQLMQIDALENEEIERVTASNAPNLEERRIANAKALHDFRYND